MPVLLLATSGPHAEVGLRLPDGSIATEALAPGATRGRDVMPAVAALLGHAGLQPAGLDAVLVDVGPGSFTGVRVGVTTAKTLAWSLGIPVHGVLGLDVLAAGAEAPADGTWYALRDAGRRRAYAARYTAGARDGDPARLGPSALREALDTADGWTAEDPARLAGTHGLPGAGHPARASAHALWSAGAVLLAEGRATPAHALAPRYLQASAPERLRDGEAPGDAV